MNRLISTCCALLLASATLAQEKPAVPQPASTLSRAVATSVNRQPAIPRPEQEAAAELRFEGGRWELRVRSEDGRWHTATVEAPTSPDRREAIAATAAALARIDVSAALAERAVEGDWSRPDITEQPGIAITAGRHPVVEAALSKAGGRGYNRRVN